MFLFVLNAVAGECSANNLPEKAGFVHDFADILNDQTEQEFESYLNELWLLTSVEMVVLTVKQIKKQDEYDYAREIFKHWNIGSETHDGVLILLSLKERIALIEVGRGLEQILPQNLSRSILNNTMIPLLKKNKYDDGISEGILSLSSWIRAGRGSITGKIENDFSDE